MVEVCSENDWVIVGFWVSSSIYMGIYQYNICLWNVKNIVLQDDGFCDFALVGCEQYWSIDDGFLDFVWVGCEQFCLLTMVSGIFS